MSAALSQKAQTKLKTFLKEKEKPAKRFKSLVSFIESGTKDEVKSFFVEKYEQIFAVLLARFADLESSQKKEKKQHIPNVQAVIGVLKQFILLLAPQIRKKWQYANLSRVMDSCLNEHNKQCVRKDGLDLLLTFMEVLGDQMEELVGKFATTIIYEPFLRPEEDKDREIRSSERDKDEKRKRADPAFASSPEMACLAPGLQSPTRSDAVELTKFYFDFISRPERVGRFDFWLELWKQSYFCLFFPKLSLELGIIDRIEVKRFEEGCPPELLAALNEQIAHWTDDPALNPIIWNNTNGPLMMEISRQACCLPISHHVIIKQSMDIFKNTLLSVSPVKIKVSEEWRQQYWKKFIDNLSHIFFISSKTIEQFERHAFLIKELLNIYVAFPLELARFLLPDTWAFLQQTMLDTTHKLLSSTSPFALDSVAPTNNVADTMLQSLFLVWIRSEVTTEPMWQDFRAKLTTLTNWKATLTQWEEKVLQLTYILIEHTYPKPVVPEPKKNKKGNVVASEAEGSPTTASAEDNKEKEPEGADDKKKLSSTSSSSSPSVPLTSSSSTSLAAIPVRARDVRLTSMAWNQARIQAMWDIILHILGNVCNIMDPPNFTSAIGCISQVVDLLCEAEDRLDITADPPIPIQRIFLPWILEATAVGEKRNRGQTAAYSTLCKLFTRKTYKPPHIDLITHFYRAIHLALGSHTSGVWVVIRNCTQLFSLPLPGVAVLIPDFLREIEKLWRPNQKNATPDDVQNRSLLILLSLVCYPTHFEQLDLPAMSAAEMHAQLGSIFVAAINYPSISPANKALALWGLGVFIYADLLNNPQKERLTEYLKALVGSCCSPLDVVARTALESLSSLIASSDMFERIAAVDPALVSYIIETLSDDIIIAISAVKATHKPLDEKEGPTAAHFYTLLDGLMAIGHSPVLELPPNVVHKVFRALEFGLLGDEIQLANPLAALASHSSSFASTAATTPLKGGSSVKREKGKIVNTGDRDSVHPSTGGGSGAENKSLNLEGIFETLKNQPAHKSDLVRESAEVFLLTMLNFFANFPTIAGCEQIISRESLEEILGPSSSAVIKKVEQEEEDDGGLYFVYNSLALFSFEEFVDDNERLVRMIVRDCTGKYVWDFDLSYDLFKSKEPQVPPSTIVPNLLPARSSEVVLKSDFKRSEDVIPTFEACKGFHVDPLNELLHFLADNEADLVTPSPRNPEANKRFSQRMKFNEPIVPNPAYAEDLQAMMVAVGEQREQLEQLLAAPSPVTPALPSLPTRPVTATKYHHTRLLLSHMGFLTDENRLKFCFLENNKRMQRSLKELDKVNAREVAKVGLIYVRDGQHTQHEILKNDAKSKDYADFVQSLGWTVDLKTHRGFLGGLDRWAGSTGETAPYWSSAMVEAIFHDVTRMPTKEGDPQQIHKKRHVGNDAVHIVWTENKRDYDPQTITSQFNDVHIIISPMANGLYRIQISKKQQDLNFGPLQDGMIVDKAMLGPLARLTAINANRAVRSLKKENKRPFPFRAGLIREMYERYKAERSFDDYFSAFFRVDDNPQSLAAATAKMQASLTVAQVGDASSAN